MRNISLLPIEIRLQRKSAQRWNVIVAVMGLAVAVFIMIFIAISAFMLMPGGELNAVKQERIDVQNSIEKLKPYEEKLNHAKEVEALLTQAMSSNPEWGSLFTGIYNKMPDNVWLSDFTVNYTGQGGEYDMKGSAKSHDDVADWLDSLQKISGISDVQCQFATKNEAADGSSSMVTFEIKAKILPGTAYVPATKGGLN